MHALWEALCGWSRVGRIPATLERDFKRELRPLQASAEGESGTQ
jgi:hypothetical protein